MKLKYICFRLYHEVAKKIGIYILRHPIYPKHKYFLSLNDWINLRNIFVIDSDFRNNGDQKVNNKLRYEVERILSGELLFFNKEWKKISLNYDWVTNIDSGYRYDPSLHWSNISDFTEIAGDIKYVWEKSRFSYLLTIIRNDFFHNQDHSNFIFSEIESWIDSNPINQGPNWRCSQEISLRLINWSFALNFYKNSSFLSDKLWGKIQNVIFWSLHHIYTHINFSRIAVRNNHAITETLILSISNLLFPFIPETKIWSKKGRKWFEKEVKYQIYDDGTFLQFSMNYHRVVIQLLSFGISITEINNQKFSFSVYEKAYKSLNFLYQCLQEENGKLPNYGANDGALFFPLSDKDYTDFRPQLNTLHKILTGKHLYNADDIMEDSLWFTTKLSKKENILKPLIKKFGTSSFDIGGYYLFRDDSSFTFIRCGNHNDRPSHADNLHIDIWVNGENIIRDSGSYKYNTKRELSNYFSGTSAHNTVVLDGNSQMLKGGRFIWYFWTQSLGSKFIETEGEIIFSGSISAFKHLKKGIIHNRTIIKKKNFKSWVVIDEIIGAESLSKSQIWNFIEGKVEIEAFESDKKIDPEIKNAYFSEYYGQKVQGKSMSFPFKRSIQTNLNGC